MLAAAQWLRSFLGGTSAPPMLLWLKRWCNFCCSAPTLSMVITCAMGLREVRSRGSELDDGGKWEGNDFKMRMNMAISGLARVYILMV